MMHRFPIAKKINAAGLTCPEPMMLLYASLNELKPGQSVEISGDDPASPVDIQKMCSFLSHEIVYQWQEKPHFLLVVRKRQHA